MEKEDEIQKMLDKLDLPARNWTINDHWEADRCAIGLSSSSNLKKVAYVSTFSKPSGRFYCELEERPAQGPNDIGSSTDLDTHEDVLIDQLEAILADFLG